MWVASMAPRKRDWRATGSAAVQLHCGWTPYLEQAGWVCTRKRAMCAPRLWREESKMSAQLRKRAYRMSELEQFQSCPRLWQYKYLELLEPARFSGLPRPVGTAVHAGVAAIWEGRSKAEALGAAEAAYEEALAHFDRGMLTEEDRTKIADGLMQVQECVRYYPYGPGDVDEVVAVEKELEAELSPGVVLRGRVDRLVRHNGMLWVHDTKTTGLDIQTVSKLFGLRAQFAGYVMLATHAFPGEAVAGLMVDFIKKPRVNRRRDGSFSSLGETAHAREVYGLTGAKAEEFLVWVDQLEESIQEVLEGTRKALKHAGACMVYNSLCPFFDLCNNPQWDERMKSVLFRKREPRGEEVEGE